MNKYPVYPGSIPLDVNILQPQRSTEIALGFLMQAAFGTGTVIDGLAVTQTVSPSMGVLVGPGAIIVATTVDTVVSGFGSLPVDTNPLVKVGINLTPTTLTTLAAPITAGQSQNTLVEAQFLEADGTPVVLPYYNSANPAVPFTGPANAGTPNNTARTNTVQLQYKQGTAAATGSQNTPTPDAGWVGVAIITVANGQSSVLNANITPYSLAPYVPTKLPQQRRQLLGNTNIYVSTTGSDTANSGLSTASPFLTLQKAWNYIVSSLDLNGFQVSVNVSGGTYSSGVHCVGIPVGTIGSVVNSPGSPPPPVKFIGNVGSPASVVVSASNSNCFQASNGAAISVSGFQLTASGFSSDYNQQGTGLYAAFNGIIAFSSVNFGACANAHITSTVSSIVETDGPGIGYSIVGSANAHINTFNTSYVTITGATVTLTGTPAFAAAFVNASYNATIDARSITFVGPATGRRFGVNNNGSINTSGGGSNYFPGNLAGTQDTATFGSIV